MVKSPFTFLSALIEALKISSKVSYAMQPYVVYYLNFISEILFIILHEMVGQTMIIKNTRFIKFLENFLWAYILAPLWEILRSTIISIIGYYNSSSARWVRAKLYELIIWLRGVTATEWLTFIAILIFWPLILLIYIVQSIMNLLKVSESMLSVIIDPLFSILHLISPDDIDISKHEAY